MNAVEISTLNVLNLSTSRTVAIVILLHVVLALPSRIIHIRVVLPREPVLLSALTLVTETFRLNYRLESEMGHLPLSSIEVVKCWPAVHVFDLVIIQF